MAFTQITVTGTYQDATGAPLSGSVTFRLSTSMHDAAGGIVRAAEPVVATLDSSGRLSVSLAANDDPTTSPTGVTYAVEERLTGADGTVTSDYSVVVPHNAVGGTVLITELAPVTNQSVSYGVLSVDGKTGAVVTDPDLLAIAALDSTVAGALATDGAGWVRKTYAALKTALALVKTDVGLGNVDNTSDVSKPVSTAQQTALDGKVMKTGDTMSGDLAMGANRVTGLADPALEQDAATRAYVLAQIAALVNSAPAILDTLGEIATQLQSDESTATALATTVAGKLAKASNLSDLASAATARTNLGLGSIATHPTSDFLTPSQGNGSYRAIGLPVSRVPSPPTGLTYITTFQAGHGWTSKGASGAPTLNLNDTTNYVLGSQAVSVTNLGVASAFQSIGKFAQPAVDLTGKHLALLVMVDDPTKVGSLYLYIGDTSLANNYLTRPVDSDSATGGATIPPGVWTWVYFSPKQYQVDGGSTAGTPNLAAITDWQLRVNGGVSGTSNTYIGAVGYFTPPSTLPNGAVVISFDDSFVSQYTLARPLLDAFGFPVNLSTIVSQIGLSGYLTLAQLQEMYSVHMCDVIGHAWTQANHNAGYETLDAATVTNEMLSLKGWLLGEGFLRGADVFAWPRGTHTVADDAIAAQYFAAARGVQEVPMPSPKIGYPMGMRALSVQNTVTTATVNARLDAAKAAGAVMSLVFHDLTTATSGLAPTQYITTDFNTILTHIQANGVPVLTYSQLLALVA